MIANHHIDDQLKSNKNSNTYQWNGLWKKQRKL